MLSGTQDVMKTSLSGNSNNLSSKEKPAMDSKESNQASPTNLSNPSFQAPTVVESSETSASSSATLVEEAALPEAAPAILLNLIENTELTGPSTNYLYGSQFDHLQNVEIPDISEEQWPYLIQWRIDVSIPETWDENPDNEATPWGHTVNRRPLSV